MPTYLTSEHLEEPVEVTERLVIGRKAKLCDLAFTADKSISARHCFVMEREQQVVIRDLESKNGVFVNGIRISGVHPLRIGDRLRLGHSIELQLVDVLRLPEPEYVSAAREAAIAARASASGVDPVPEPDSSATKRRASRPAARSNDSVAREALSPEEPSPAEYRPSQRPRPESPPYSEPPTYAEPPPYIEPPRSIAPRRTAPTPKAYDEAPKKPLQRIREAAPPPENPVLRGPKAKRRKQVLPELISEPEERTLNNDFDALNDAVQLERGSVGRKVHKVHCDQCDHWFSVMVAKHVLDTACPACDHEILLDRKLKVDSADEPIRYTDEWRPAVRSLETIGNIGLFGMGLVMLHFVVFSLFGAAYYGKTAFSVFIPFEEGGVDLPQSTLLIYGGIAALFAAMPIVVLFIASFVAEEFNGVLRLAAIIGVPVTALAWHKGTGQVLVRTGFLVYGIPLAFAVVPMVRLWQLPRRLVHLISALRWGTIGLAIAATGILIAAAIPFRVPKKEVQQLGELPEMVGVPGLALAAMIALIAWGAGQMAFSLFFSGSASAIKEPKVREAMDMYFYFAVGTLVICVMMLGAMAVPLITGPTADFCWLIGAGAATCGTIWFYQLPTFLRDSIH